MKRIVILLTFLTIFISFSCFLISNICYARGSGIYKPIQSYTCDAYYDVFETGELEGQIYNYYQARKIALTITKKITSQAYIEQIREFILEDWTPPFYYTREEIAYKFDKVFDNIYIVQVVDFDFRRKFRNAIVMSEALWGVKGNETPVCIFTCAGDEILPGNRVVYDIDYDEEYGQIANDAVDFLESIKDIYFDETKRKEHELKGITERNFNYYWAYWREKWEHMKSSNENRVIDVYVDAQSIEDHDQYLEGWVKMVWNEEKFISLQGTNKIEGFDSFPDFTAYYVRFDFKNKQFLIIAGYERFKDNSEKKYVRNEPEIWTVDKDPTLVAGVLNLVADIYNNKRDFWGSRGTRGM